MSPLFQKYEQLAEDDRKVVLTSALYYQAFSLLELNQLLSLLKWKNRHDHPLFITDHSALYRTLFEQKIWEYDHLLIRCNPQLSEAVMEDAKRNDTLRLFAELLVAHEPFHAGRRSRSKIEEKIIEEQQLRRAGLFARLLDDETLLFHALFEKRERIFLHLSDTVATLLYPIFEENFEHYSPELRFSLLESQISRLDASLGSNPQMEKSFLQLFSTPGLAPPIGVIITLADHHLMRGRFEVVRAILAHFPQPTGKLSIDKKHLSAIFYPQRLLGVLAFLEGDDPEAIRCFEKAIQVGRNLFSKRKQQLLSGLYGAFFMLALLRENSSGSQLRLQELLKLVPNQFFQDRHNEIQILLADTIEKLLAAKENPRLAGGLNAAERPWYLLFAILTLYWQGQKLTAKELLLLAKAQQKAVAGGSLWYAREAALLLQQLNYAEECHYDESAVTTKPLTNLRQPESHWERSLRGLRELANPRLGHGSGTQRQEIEGAQRIAWEISDSEEGVQIEPKAQKLGRRGWSKGRRIALRRLAEELESVEGLGPEDRLICACIERYIGEERWGYHQYSYYQLKFPCAFEAAVGHPYLFYQGEPTTLVAEHPYIFVSRQKRNILIQLLPENPELLTVVLKQTADALRFYPFTAQHATIYELLDNGALQVPREAEQVVLETIAAIAPLITIHSEIGGEVGDAVERVESDSRLHLHLQPLTAGLQIRCCTKPLGDQGPTAHPGRGASTIFSEVAGKRLHTERDLASERANAEQLFATCPALDPEQWEWSLNDLESALETLEQLPALGERVVLEWPQGKRVRLTPTPQAQQMAIKISSQQDWFALSGELTLDDGRVIDMTHLLKLLLDSPGRFVKLGEEEYLALSQDLRRRLQTLHNLQDRGRIHPLTTALLDETLDGVRVESGPEWQQQLQRLREAEALQPQLPSTLQAELRDYQIEGFCWLARLAHWGAGACLADDMGLGKTLQALALLLTRAPDGPALVLAPTSVCGNWMEESHRFAPTLNTHLFGPGDRSAMLQQAGPFDLIICSYGLLQSEGEAFAEVQWHTIVADEAQAFKNPHTKRSQAMMALRGSFRLITTGTPIENHLGELWNLFRFINPGLLGSAERFNQRFTTPIEQQQPEARQQLKRLIRPFILRRLKSQVLTELPERTEVTLRIALSEEERTFYEALRRTALERVAAAANRNEKGDARFQVLAEITRLRRACCNPRLILPETPIPSAKLQAFIEVVEELRESHHKALVFSQFVDHLSLVREWLDQQAIPYQYLDGSTPAKKRQQVVADFQRGEGDLFLISLKAGGSGLNLTAADYVIHLDPWWNPAVEDQASDRAHRLGQQRPVTIYRLVAQQTIEESILALHGRKRDLADSLLEGSASASRMGVEEMMDLLREG